VDLSLLEKALAYILDSRLSMPVPYMRSTRKTPPLLLGTGAIIKEGMEETRCWVESSSDCYSPSFGRSLLRLVQDVQDVVGFEDNACLPRLTYCHG
jgi:hypothetical protein